MLQPHPKLHTEQSSSLKRHVRAQQNRLSAVCCSPPKYAKSGPRIHKCVRCIKRQTLTVQALLRLPHQHSTETHNANKPTHTPFICNAFCLLCALRQHHTLSTYTNGTTTYALRPLPHTPSPNTSHPPSAVSCDNNNKPASLPMLSMSTRHSGCRHPGSFTAPC